MHRIDAIRVLDGGQNRAYVKYSVNSGSHFPMRLLVFIIIVLISCNSQAQDSTVLFIPAGRSISEVATPQKIYRFPNFIKGKIYFRDSRVTAGNLNYNYLIGELEFISPQGDTLALIKDQAVNIKYIELDSIKLYYNGSYLEEVADFGSAKILKRQQYRLLKREKIGGYEQPSSTSAIESYSSFTSDDGIMAPRLIVRENVTLVRPAQYFVGDEYNTFLPANKKNIVSLFQKNKRQIEAYLRNNEVDYKNLDHLKKLFASMVPAQ